MAPKINTSDSYTSGSGQKLRNDKGSTHLGRYEELKLARARIQAHNVAKEAKNARLTKARTIRQARGGSDTTLSPRVPVTAENNARKSKRGHQRTSYIWQHMTQKEVDGRQKTVCNYCGINWFLGGSTSNAQKHLKTKHLDKITGRDASTTEASGGYHKNIQYKSSAATAAPALANFAMIMAKNNAREYVKILNNLYKDNGLQAPDFTKYLP